MSIRITFSMQTVTTFDMKSPCNAAHQTKWGDCCGVAGRTFPQFLLCVIVRLVFLSSVTLRGIWCKPDRFSRYFVRPDVHRPGQTSARTNTGPDGIWCRITSCLGERYWPGRLDGPRPAFCLASGRERSVRGHALDS